MPFFENRHHEALWYEDTGAGIPLVFLHGWCMSSSVWVEQLKRLADGFRVITPDLRGHGRSRAVTERLDFEACAADLADLFNYLNLERALLVGWSLGGQVALQACNRLADRLAGLVLVSATPRFTATEDFAFGLLAKDVIGMRLKVERNMQRAMDGFNNRMFAEGELEDHAQGGEIRALLAGIDPPDRDAARAALMSLAEADMRPLLGCIRLPVLIVNGDSDRICLPEASHYLATQIRGARQIVFKGCGHALFMTQPEQFNHIIDQFTRSASEQYA
ncbi:MAG TPA: alpha/beta fold hydrolase [Desulfuromonadales bacterium]|nr:alpha/beta fold hydrolase [Desulfuromonadales bacterium]